MTADGFKEKGGKIQKAKRKENADKLTLSLWSIKYREKDQKEGKILEQIMEYVKPELVIVAAVLYFVGIGLKKTQAVKDKYIPIILGIAGIVLCAVWVLATETLSGVQDIAMAIFTAVVQGILVAGLSNYANQVVKQVKKEE